MDSRFDNSKGPDGSFVLQGLPPEIERELIRLAQEHGTDPATEAARLIEEALRGEEDFD